MKKYKNNLVVGLDQSLLKIDLFKEVLAVSLINNPRVFFKTILLAIYNKAEAKDFIAKNTKIVCNTLPCDNLVFASASNNNKVLLLAVLLRFTIMISNLPGVFVALLDKKAFQTNIGEMRNFIE